MQQDSDQRTRKQLKQAVLALLRGCEYHYEKSVTRVSRAAGIIPPETCHNFIKCARGLVTLSNPDAYQQQVAYINQQYHFEIFLNKLEKDKNL